MSSNSTDNHQQHLDGKDDEDHNMGSIKDAGMTLQKEGEVPFLKRCMQHLHKQLQTVKQLFTKLKGSQLDIPAEAVRLNSIRDDDKCLPEDTELEDELQELEIPGMVPLQSGELTSYQKVVHQIKGQLLGTEPHILQEIFQILAPYENDVFERATCQGHHQQELWT
jgi:hypothetical protein